MPQKSTVLAAMTYLHTTVWWHYYRRWRVLRFCSEWKEVVPRRFDDREHCAFNRTSILLRLTAMAGSSVLSYLEK